MQSYVVYDTQDSSWYRDGLSESEARALCDERNSENSRRGLRYAVATASEFAVIIEPVE